MPFELQLPPRLVGLKRAGWKVKIREKETREPPHVTILRGVSAWRIDLRTARFMDRRPDPAEVPEALLAFVREAGVWERLCREWDAKYPDNPVQGIEEE